MKQKQTYVGNTICHQCKEDISIDTAVRSLTWAFGILGVRWLVCSKECAEKLRDDG
jgi:hypothetical protein